MHPCSKTPSLKGPEDEGCLQLLTSTFSFIYRIGNKTTVSASLVFKLSQETQDLAVKIIPLREENDLKDVKIACLLNGLLSETPIFIRTFGWIKCKEIPSLWIRGINFKKDVPESFTSRGGGRKYPFLFLATYFTSHTWGDKNIHLDLEEYRVMLFLLLHGLWLANKRYGFKHNDIHQGQILFQICKPDTPITISVNEYRYTVVCQRFVPKLVDFGLSTLSGEDSRSESDDSGSESGDDMFETSSSGFGDDDLNQLFYVFEERMRKDGLKPFVIQKGPTTTLESILLKDPLFDSLRNPVSFVESRLFCDVCSSAANVQWQKHGIRFCDEKCAYQWTEISKIL